MIVCKQGPDIGNVTGSEEKMPLINAPLPLWRTGVVIWEIIYSLKTHNSKYLLVLIDYHCVKNGDVIISYVSDSDHL